MRCERQSPEIRTASFVGVILYPLRVSVGHNVKKDAVSAREGCLLHVAWFTEADGAPCLKQLLENRTKHLEKL